MESSRGSRRNLIVGLALVLAGSAVYLNAARIWSHEQAPRFRRALTNDKGLRQQATHAPSPSYPAGSLSRKVTGVAVAKVTVDANGRTETVNILEAPDDAIGRAVREAVLRWTYKPVGVPITGDLVFYFHINQGRGIISSPEEMKTLKKFPAENNKGLPWENSKGNEAIAKEINETEFKRLKLSLNPVVLDVRERTAYDEAHRDGAMNIPLRELLARGPAELPLSRPIVIDCFARDYEANICRIAAHLLTSSGFSQVLVLKR